MGQTMSALEVVAFATGLATVWLTKQRHILNWPVGLVNVACFMLLFYEARLYADALLQIFFMVLGVIGWRNWAVAARASATHEPQVTRIGARQAVLALAGATVLIALGATALGRWTDSPVPVADTTLLVLSLLATWWQVQRRLECWLLWITVDLISVPLYWSRGLPLTSVLYVVFLCICVAGWIDWRRSWQHEAARGGVAAGGVATAAG